MTTARWMITSLFALAAPLGLLACDGDDDGAGDEAAEAGDETTGDETTGGEEGDETLGRTDADVGADEGSLDFGEAGDGDTDQPMGCSVHLEKADCDAASGCASVLGNAILPEGDGWCSSAETEYIGCVETGNLCPPLTKILCGGDHQIWSTKDCVPDTLMVCEPPGDISNTCGDALVRI
jgi:hypothetical protein